MEGADMTKELLIEAAKAGTLTPEQEVEFYVQVLNLPRPVAEERVYTDWDQVAKNRITGEGPIP